MRYVDALHEIAATRSTRTRQGRQFEKSCCRFTARLRAPTKGRRDLQRAPRKFCPGHRRSCVPRGKSLARMQAWRRLGVTFRIFASSKREAGPRCADGTGPRDVTQGQWQQDNVGRRRPTWGAAFSSDSFDARTSRRRSHEQRAHPRFVCHVRRCSTHTLHRLHVQDKLDPLRCFS